MSPEESPPSPPAPGPSPEQRATDDRAASVRSMWRTTAQLSYVGIFFGVAIMIGYGVGRWIERRWGGSPWPSMAGVLVGIASGFREVFRVARSYKRMNREGNGRD